MPEHPAVKIARMWSSWAPEAKAELESRWPILAVTLTQLAESTMSSAEETLTELQVWLKKRRDKGFRHAAEVRDHNYDSNTGNYPDYAQRAAYGWTREATMAQQTLDWLETKRSGNG